MTGLGRLLDWLVPPRCLGCGERDRWLCASCAAGLPPLPDARCRVCARPLTAAVAVCADCYRDRPPVERLYAGFRHQGLARRIVLDLKYAGHRHLAAVMAELLADRIPRDTDRLVPVPLHPSRQRERGFNQAELLAHALGRITALSVSSTLTRTRPTGQQAGLAPRQRVENVRGAFEAVGRLDGQRLLLVDDVCTTGATLHACARALRRAGAASVSATTFTRADTGLIDV